MEGHRITGYKPNAAGKEPSQKGIIGVLLVIIAILACSHAAGSQPTQAVVIPDHGDELLRQTALQAMKKRGATEIDITDERIIFIDDHVAVDVVQIGQYPEWNGQVLAQLDQAW